MFRVLIVDDDAQLRQTAANALAGRNYKIDQAENGRTAVEAVRKERADLVIMDVNMPELNGIEALKQIKAHDPSIIVIMLTAYSNVEDAVAAVKEGAYNYVSKPVRHDEIIAMVDRALEANRMIETIALSAPVVGDGTSQTEDSFIGQSREMKGIFSVIHKLSKVDTAVLIRGESGTGKELVARAIHYNSVRKNEKFVAVNCSAIPENLIESELFGHEKGSFTGADSRKIGRFQYAEGGTLFLDEIGDVSPAMQVKLLRVLQERKFTPVGANREIAANVRIVAATNRNLEEMIRNRSFREDLFYRLNVLPIFLPPLRDRKEDIPALVNYFMSKFNRIHQRQITAISPSALEALRRHEWPGNIRELENVIEHAFVLEAENIIQASSLPPAISGLQTRFVSEGPGPILTDPSGQPRDLVPEALDFQAQKENFEREFIIKALKTNGGRINMTARNTNIPKKTLLRKIEKYGINPRDYGKKPMQTRVEVDATPPVSEPLH